MQHQEALFEFAHDAEAEQQQQQHQQQLMPAFIQQPAFAPQQQQQFMQAQPMFAMAPQMIPIQMMQGTASPSAAPGTGGGTGSGNNSRTSAANMSNSASRRQSERSLFISGLHPDCEFTHLHERFQRYGKIISSRVLRDAKTGMSRCIGYVNFASAPDAANAINGENGQSGPQGGGPMTIRYAEDDPAFVPEENKKIFIRYVPLNMPTERVRAVFSEYGTVTECTVMPDMSSASKTDAEPWNMAYVTFASAEEATLACAKTNRSFALGDRHALLVKPAETLATRTLRQRKHDGSSSSHYGGSSRGYDMSGSNGGVPVMGAAAAAGATPMIQPPPGFQLAYMPSANGGLMPIFVPLTTGGAQPQMMFMSQPTQATMVPVSLSGPQVAVAQPPPPGYQYTVAQDQGVRFQ